MIIKIKVLRRKGNIIMNNSVKIVVFMFLTGLMACCDKSSGEEQENPYAKLKQCTFYIDSNNGNDANLGLSAASPWKTFSRLADITLRPGDSIRFKRGSSFVGPLDVIQSGLAGKYITLTDYGAKTDPAPSFTNPVFKQDNFGNCIRIKGSYVIVENLYFQHTAAYVDAAGFYTTDGGWDVWHMGAVFIAVGAKNCIIRNNEMFDCVAGIRSYGEGALIEGNYIHDCNRPLKMWNWGPKGIWLGGDYQTVRNNRVFNMIVMDDRMLSGGSGGGAFEIDDGRYLKSHITISHNYTRGNHGFLEVVFNDVVADPAYENFIIAYNVADDYQSFVKLRKSRNCIVDNNTIVRRRKNSNEAGVFILKENNVMDKFRNNIIVMASGVRAFAFNGGAPNITVQNNLFYSLGGAIDYGDGNQGISAIIGDPLFVNSALGNDLADFALSPGSPAIDKGLNLGYTTDINGKSVSGVPDLGAIEQ